LSVLQDLIAGHSTMDKQLLVLVHRMHLLLLHLHVWVYIFYDASRPVEIVALRRAEVQRIDVVTATDASTPGHSRKPVHHDVRHLALGLEDRSHHIPIDMAVDQNVVLVVLLLSMLIVVVTATASMLVLMIVLTESILLE